MSEPFNAFDKFGKVRQDLSKKTIAGLPPAQRNGLVTLMEASLNVDTAEAAKIVAERAVRDAIDHAHNMRQAYFSVRPKATFLSEHKRTIAANQGHPIKDDTDPEVIKRAEIAAKAADDADSALDQRRTEAEDIRQNLAQCRIRLGQAVVAWAKLDGSPKTTADLVRAMSKAEREQKLDDIANPKPLPPPAEPVHVWPITTALANNKGVKRPRAFLMKQG
jgi:hypothetical protein